MKVQITNIHRLGKIICFQDVDNNKYLLSKDSTPSLFRLAYDPVNVNRNYDLGEYDIELFPDTNIISCMR